MYTATCFNSISDDLQSFSMDHNYKHVNVKSLYIKYPMFYKMEIVLCTFLCVVLYISVNWMLLI